LPSQVSCAEWSSSISGFCTTPSVRGATGSEMSSTAQAPRQAATARSLAGNTPVSWQPIVSGVTVGGRTSGTAATLAAAGSAFGTSTTENSPSGWLTSVQLSCWVSG
jgi:hypothetical protein